MTLVSSLSSSLLHLVPNKVHGNLHKHTQFSSLMDNWGKGKINVRKIMWSPRLKVYQVSTKPQRRSGKRHCWGRTWEWSPASVTTDPGPRRLRSVLIGGVRDASPVPTVEGDSWLPSEPGGPPGGCLPAWPQFWPLLWGLDSAPMLFWNWCFSCCFSICFSSVNIGIAETLLGNIDAVHGIKGKSRLWFCSPCRKERIIRRDGCRALLMEGLLEQGLRRAVSCLLLLLFPRVGTGNTGPRWLS